MHPIRFDRWTKSLVRAGSRRAALRMFAAGGVAALARLGLVEVAAACLKNGKKCKKSKQCCSGQGADEVCCSNPGATVGCWFHDQQTSVRHKWLPLPAGRQ